MEISIARWEARPANRVQDLLGEAGRVVRRGELKPRSGRDATALTSLSPGAPSGYANEARAKGNANGPRFLGVQFRTSPAEDNNYIIMYINATSIATRHADDMT